MKILFCLIFIIVYPVIGYPQSEKSVERANEFFRLEEYVNAIKYYQLALNKENNKSIIAQIANCYRLVNNDQEAQLYYEKILDENPDSNTCHYALVLKKNGEYQKAKKQFNLLSGLFPEVKDYVLMGVFCDSAIRWTKQKSQYAVKNITEVNTEYSDITPVIYKNGIVYASNREETIIRKKTGYSEQPYYNLFISSLSSKGKYQKGKSFSPLINMSAHESAPSFSGNFKKIYFTRVNEKQKTRSTQDKFNRPKLYSSEEKGGHWTKPEKFIFNDSLCSFGHPSVDSTEKMFFFVSDMPGGFGGTDIYVCFNFDNKWTDPHNLGPVVNTKNNELYPFYHEDGTLFFASDGHMGMGGFDIYSAVQLNGDWVKVINMKPPVNSSSDDFSIFLNKEKSRGYFSSNRPGGLGAEDIYLIEVPGK